MTSLIIISALLVTFTVSTTHGASAQRNPNTLTYLGLYKSPSVTAVHEKREVTPVSQQTSYYFLSQNSAGHFTADRDCKDYLGEEASLAQIETKEELKVITKFFAESDDSGSFYWIGCKYDPSRHTFVWLNTAELGPWAPWDAGHPDTTTPVTRVSVHTQGSRFQSGLKFRTQFQTVSNRFICELKVGNPEEEAFPCYKSNDLLVIVDSSDAVSKGTYVLFMEFITRLAIAWADHPENRIGIIITAESGQSIFSLNDTLTITEFRDNFFKAPKLSGGPALDQGVTKAIEEFESHGRHGLTHSLVLLTESKVATAEADWTKLHTAGINVFAVGVGGGESHKTDLLAVTGDNEPNVFVSPEEDNVLRILQPLSKKICLSGPEVTTKKEEEPKAGEGTVSHVSK